MIHIRSIRVWVLALVSVVFAASVVANEQMKQAATESAVLVMRQCFQPDREGKHNLMLGALRQLKDPELRPFFSELVNEDDPVLQIHGVLGVSEVSEDGQIDLVRLGNITSTIVQTEIISTAMREDMVSDVKALEMLIWPGMEEQLKVLVSTQLVESGKLEDTALLIDALDSQVPGVRYWSGMLLAQMGESKGFEVLEEIGELEDDERERTWRLLLGQAYLSEFDKLGGWALSIAKQEGVQRRLRSLALKIALRFDADGAEEFWRNRYTAAEGDDAVRRLLAIELLSVSPWVEAEMFSVLEQSDDDLVAKIGQTGKAVALDEGAGDAVVALVGERMILCSQWALKWAERDAGDADAIKVYRSVIDSYDFEHRSSKLASLVMEAVELLFSRDPEGSVDYLRGIVSGEDAQQVLMIQYVLMGLLNCTEGHPDRVFHNVAELENTNSQAMRVLLKAKHSGNLTDSEMVQFITVVRGGVAPLPSLRVQAAWTYIRLTDQTRMALAKILAGRNQP